MPEIQLRTDIKVEMVECTRGGDTGVARAAWISTENEPRQHDPDRIPKLINYLIGYRHGTPFEHNSITFRVEAPIFVFREWHRHRVQSYNEQSGRYTEFLPHFYMPAEDRPLVNTGTSARPLFGDGGDYSMYDDMFKHVSRAFESSWNEYQVLLERGVAKEVARIVLPVATYSSMYATANLRAWLHFISLRTSEPNAHWQGHPQYEIVQAARAIEVELAKLYPITLEAFNKHGRVAP